MRKQVVCLCLILLLAAGSVGSVLAAPEPAAADEELPKSQMMESMPSEVEAAPTTSPEPTESAPEASSTPSPAQEELTSPAAETVAVAVRTVGSGRIEKDGVAADGNVFVVTPNETLTLKVYPESGYMLRRVAFDGQELSAIRSEDGSSGVSLVPARSGELEVVFVRLHEIAIEVAGDAAVSYTAGSETGTAVSGNVLSFPEDVEVLFSVQPGSGHRFEGAEFNGRSLSTTAGASATQFRLAPSEGGTLSIRLAKACVISTILDNCTLLIREGAQWSPLPGGDAVISLAGGARVTFAVRPRTSYVLGTLLVNGVSTPTVAQDGNYVFTITAEPGVTTIAAVCHAVTESIEGTDSRTGVRYRLPGTEGEAASNITEDSWISVDRLTEGPLYTQAVEQAKPYGDLLCVYDLKLYNAAGSYKPSVPITVSIPIPDTYRGGKLKVLHEVNQVVTEIPYRTEDIQGVPCVTIFTDSFSLYMLVDAVEDALAPAVQNPESTSTDGDPFGAWILVAIAVLGALGVAIYCRHRRQTAH